MSDKPKKSEKSEIAKVNEDFPCLDPAAIAENRAAFEEMGVESFVPSEMPVVKIDGNQLRFTDPLGNEEHVDSIEGILCAAHMSGKLYSREYSAGQGSAPYLVTEGVKAEYQGNLFTLAHQVGDDVGVLDIDKLSAAEIPDHPGFYNWDTLHYAQWGSDLKGGRGKACQEGKRLTILPKGASVPVQFESGPSNIRSLEAFFRSLVQQHRGVRLHQHLIRMEVVEIKSGNYSPKGVKLTHLGIADDATAAANLEMFAGPLAKLRLAKRDQFESGAAVAIESKVVEGGEEAPF